MTLNAALLRGLLIAIAAAAVSPLLFRTARRESLSLIGLPAALLYFREAFPGFLIVIGLAYLVARALGSIADRLRRWRWTGVALVLLVATFTAGRLGRWDQRAMLAAGEWSVALCTFDMWLTLRLVTLFWEVGSGQTLPPSFAGYLGWVAFPMTLGGSLLRYSELPGTFETSPALWLNGPWWRALALGGSKLLAGVLLGFLPSFITARWPGAHLLNALVVVFVSGPLGFYLVFAGYYHLMQTLARPVGLAIPDSFNWPLGRENISAFWASWNMTATRVFRDYLFYNRWGLRRYNIYVNTLVLFTLVGLWHSANAYWVLWGFLHGVMFCGFLLWRRLKVARGLRGPAAPWTPMDIVGRVATYVCVCAAWYLPSKILHWLGVI